MTSQTPATDCGRGNCKILNPVRPDLWCCTCLRQEVETLREALRQGRRHDAWGRALLPSND